MEPPQLAGTRKATTRRKFTGETRYLNVTLPSATFARLQALRGDVSMGMAVEYLINRAWERRERKNAKQA